jgi:methylated-DNA-[protein]-cysteine S-methyltransferase
MVSAIPSYRKINLPKWLAATTDKVEEINVGQHMYVDPQRARETDGNNRHQSARVPGALIPERGSNSQSASTSETREHRFERRLFLVSFSSLDSPRKSAMNGYRFFLERVPTPTGMMLLVADEQERLRALDWEDHEVRMYRLLRLHYGAGLTRLEANARVSNARRAVEAYYGGAFSAIDTLDVKTAGTDFQREVWTALRAIPVGETTTYGRLAALLGRPKAMRAVGMANCANPVGVVVPCHRVIGANASLTGYGGGIARKHWLLEHEGAARPPASPPVPR